MPYFYVIFARETFIKMPEFIHFPDFFFGGGGTCPSLQPISYDYVDVSFVGYRVSIVWL